MRTVKITVQGDVQGVFFRSGVRKHLLPTTVRGYVKNLENGDVEVVAQGTEREITELIDYCHRGPVHARVIRVNVEDINPIESKTFEIKF